MSIDEAVRKREHSPRRTCLGCGLRDNQSRLIRLRAGGRGELIADDSGLGRGGYLHHGRECWEQFLRRKSMYRAFHAEIGKGAKEALIQELKGRHGA
jgi:predicted RNA-binding protein YlxR (DUF448 family)